MTQPGYLLPILVMAALTVLPASLQSAPVIPQPRPGGTPPAKGMFLVASPQMQDPNFRETVVLICEHDPMEGTLGVIMNRPTELLLSDVLPKIPVLKGTSYLLFAGGPVQPEGILMLFRVAQEPADMRRVLKGIYLGGNLQILERIVTKPEPTETFRAYAGYAGWAPGQLEAELMTGSWLLVQADSLSIFDKNPANLWGDLVEASRAPGVVRFDGSRPPGATAGLISGLIERAP
jgi:putative transcriptional regulator